MAKYINKKYRKDPLHKEQAAEGTGMLASGKERAWKWREKNGLGGSEGSWWWVFLDGRKAESGQGGEVGMGELLFLACLAICLGVKMCTHRGCPWARGGQADWQHAEANESEFLPGVATIPLWDSQRPSLPITTSTSPRLDTLPHLSLSGMPVQGSQGQACPVKIREDVCPAYRVFWS